MFKEYDFKKGKLNIECTEFYYPEKASIPVELHSEVEIIDISHLQMKRFVDFEEMYSWEIAEYHKL